MAKIVESLGRLLRWFLGSPFPELPPEFGNPMPSDVE